MSSSRIFIDDFLEPNDGSQESFEVGIRFSIDFVSKYVEDNLVK